MVVLLLRDHQHLQQGRQAWDREYNQMAQSLMDRVVIDFKGSLNTHLGALELLL